MTSWRAESGHIKVEWVRDVAIIRLDRAEKLNALTKEMRSDLATAIRYHGDGTNARGLVLTGTGRAFSAGEDLSATIEEASDNVEQAVELFHDITRAVLTTRVPAIAALNGLAVGGAAEITLCFDSRIGTSEAGFFLPENHIGLIISNASSMLLGRLMRPGAATRLVLGAGRLDAREAFDAGLIDELVGSDALIDAAVSRVEEWAPDGSATWGHLQLLRPDMAEVERVFARETQIAREAWATGVSRQGVEEFWQHRG